MSEKPWTIDSVHFHFEVPPDTDRPEGLGDDAVLGVADGRTDGGRRFQCCQWFTRELFNDQGEEKLAKLLRELAQPPELPA